VVFVRRIYPGLRLVSDAGVSYFLNEIIGKGGYSQVWKAYTNGRTVAVKMPLVDEFNPHKSADARIQFYQERENLQKFKGPAVVEILDWSVQKDREFIAMEYVAAPLLHDMVGTITDIAEIVRVLQQFARMQRVFEAAGLLDQDPKPTNVFYIDGRLKFFDLGLVSRLEDIFSAYFDTGAVIGTPSYMAVEAMHGYFVPQSVIASLGFIGIEMALGRHYDPNIPFNEVARIKKEMGFSVADSVGHDHLRSVLARAIHPDLQCRYITMAEFSTALDGLAGQLAISNSSSIDPSQGVFR
jgi:serine/threonine protein kinase